MNDPIFPGGPPTTLIGALGLGWLIGAAVIRTLWQRLGEVQRKLFESQEARVADQQAHAKEMLEAAKATHATSETLKGAIEALRHKPPPPGRD